MNLHTNTHLHNDEVVLVALVELWRDQNLWTEDWFGLM